MQAPQGYPHMIPSHLPLSIPTASALTNTGQAEEEMEDQEESEWPVRVGTAPPPTWAKRKADNESEDASSHKRQKPKSAPKFLF